MRRIAVTFTACVLACLASVQPSDAAAAPCWRAPVVGRVTDPFRLPTCPYCAGNRGIEYRVGSAVAVRAVAAGTVTYSGAIAGVRYVVVEHANGWRVTYGRLGSTRLRRGDVVARRSVVGRVSVDFYFGLRIGGAYRDPAPFLGRVMGRPRLVPTDGSPPRAAPAPILRCRSR